MARLERGFRRLTRRGVTRLARLHHHICPVYVAQHFSTLASLDGLLWWDDGVGDFRTRLLRLAWSKGLKESAPPPSLSARSTYTKAPTEFPRGRRLLAEMEAI